MYTREWLIRYSCINAHFQYNLTRSGIAMMLVLIHNGEQIFECRADSTPQPYDHLIGPLKYKILKCKKSSTLV